LGTYTFKNMRLHDVAVTPDRERLLGVGPLTTSPEGLRPSKSKVEKRLVGTFLFIGLATLTKIALVYNMETDQIEK